VLSARKVKKYMEELEELRTFMLVVRGAEPKCLAGTIDLLNELSGWLGDPDITEEPLDSWACPSCDSNNLELWEGPYYTVTPIRRTMMGLQAKWDPNKGWDELAPAWDMADDLRSHSLDRREFIVCQDCGYTYSCKVVDGDYIVEIGEESE